MPESPYREAPTQPPPPPDGYLLAWARYRRVRAAHAAIPLAALILFFVPAFGGAVICIYRGPVLRDGETFGLTAGEKIGIWHRPSRWERKGNILFLEFP